MGPPARKAPGVGQKLPRKTTLARLNKTHNGIQNNTTSLEEKAVDLPVRLVRPGTTTSQSHNSHAHRPLPGPGPCREVPHVSSLSLDSREVKSIVYHAEKTLEGFEAMWRQKILCDVTIIVGSHRMRVHKALIATCAGYFRSLFANAADDQKAASSEVCLDGISAATAEALIESMYTGKIQVSEGNVRELLAAASSLKYYAIEEACDQFLQQRLNKSNCLRMLNLASLYVLGDLRDEALRVAAGHFLELSAGFDFHQLNVDQLVMLISRDDVQVPSELEVFQSVLSWLEYDRKTRLALAANLLQEVRLPLLSPSEIVDYVETVEHLMNSPDCQQFVKEALHYHCLPARQSLLQTRRTCPRKSHQLVVLAIGGAPRLKSDPVSSDVNCLALGTSSWRKLTQMAEPRHHLAAAVCNGFLYVAGGEMTNDQRSPLNTAFRYDPRTNRWLQIASMCKQRESFQLGILNDMLYAVGGRVDMDVSLADVERYNPAVDTWELVAPLSSPRRSVALTAHNGRLYAMGGSGHKRISSKVERYNPLTDQWEGRRSLSTPRFFALLAPISNKLFLIGGATLDTNGCVVCVPKVECYVPSTDTWMTMTSMREPRAEAGLAVVGANIYVVGGYSWDNNRRLASTEIYHPDKDVWEAGPSMMSALTGVGCCAVTVYGFEEEMTHTKGEVGEDGSEGRKSDTIEQILEEGLEIDSIAGENTQLQAPSSD